MNGNTWFPFNHLAPSFDLFSCFFPRAPFLLLQVTFPIHNLLASKNIITERSKNFKSYPLCKITVEEKK